MAKTKTSRPESSATNPGTPVPFDKLYWLRIGSGAAGGFLATLATRLDAVNALWNGVTIAMVFYLASYYLARYVMYKKVGKENYSKFYTTGIGGYVMLFLFTWILLFTLT